MSAFLADLAVGDLFYAVQRGDPHRQSDPDRGYPMRVTKVARKYITAVRDKDNWGETQFERSTNREKSGYRPMFAYPDQSAYERDVLHRRRCDTLCRRLRDLHSHQLYKLDNNALTAIEQALILIHAAA